MGRTGHNGIEVYLGRLSRARATLQRIVFEQQTEESDLNQRVGSK